VIINRAKNQTSTVQPDQSTAHNQKKQRSIMEGTEKNKIL